MILEEEEDAMKLHVSKDEQGRLVIQPVRPTKPVRLWLREVGRLLAMLAALAAVAVIAAFVAAG
jgi:hypothetical protein